MKEQNLNNASTSLREKSLDWFFCKNEVEKIELKRKYYTDYYIEYSSQWGFHFTFGQIEEMYKNEQSNNLITIKQ